MHGLVVIEGMTLSGHPWIINEIRKPFYGKDEKNRKGFLFAPLAKHKNSHKTLK